MLLGKKAPEFALKDKDGVVHTLRDIEAAHVCVFFYPKDNTPGCTLEAKEFTSHLKKFSQKGCALIGISGGDEKSKAKFCKSNALEVTLLSDPDYRVAKAYKTYGEKKFMGRTYNGIFRKTFVLGPDRKIVKVFEEVKPEGHAEEVLAFLEGGAPRAKSKSAVKKKPVSKVKPAPKKAIARKKTARAKK